MCREEIGRKEEAMNERINAVRTRIATRQKKDASEATVEGEWEWTETEEIN